MEVQEECIEVHKEFVVFSRTELKGPFLSPMLGFYFPYPIVIKCTHILKKNKDENTIYSSQHLEEESFFYKRNSFCKARLRRYHIYFKKFFL